MGYVIKRKESDIKRSIVDYLHARGCVVIPYRSVGIRKPNGSYIPMQETGISDLLGINKDGQFFAVEVKNGAKGRLSESQAAFLEKVRLYGCQAIIARSLQDVIDAGF